MIKNPTIAGVILTLNEENNILRALKSLSWCDELFVVDSGSIDRTQHIVHQFGAHFITHLQDPPFLITLQRNWALENAGITSDWVFFLDADEAVGSHLAAAIRRCINLPDHVDAYELTPRYLFLGKWLKRTQAFPNWHPRLLKRKYVRFEGGVWETFVQTARVARIQEPYEHYAFSKGLDDWLERHKRYSTWDADETYAYLTHTASQQNTTPRFHIQRRLISYLWPFKPVLRFFQKYILQLGFLEGWQSLLFCTLMSFYDFMTVVKIIEKHRKTHSLPL